LHVFLSYARSSESQATAVERALRDAGYSVWRDTDLPAHLSYAEVIEERLKSAKAVLVLWSAEAAKSQWVRAEADAARELGTLVQSTVDGTVPPIPFNQIQCADLSGWSGEDDHSGWRKLKASIVALAGQVDEPAKPTRRQRAKASLCVLPFQNLSAEAVPEYFCDGLSEDIISDVSKVRGLSAIPRKTAFAFKGQEVDPCAVAEELSVSYVLEGTVRRAGDRVRITAHLTEGASGEYIWSDRYYRDFSDVFAVQDEISKVIVEAIKQKLLPSEKAGPEAKAVSPEADVKAFEIAEQSEANSAILPPSSNFAAPEEQHEAADSPSFEPAMEPVHDYQGSAESPPEWQEDQWVSDDEWGSGDDWDSDEEQRRKDFLSPHLPRIIALGLTIALVAVLAFFFWPDKPAPLPEEEPELSYTVTSNVYVRSLPTRKGSRVLGELKAGDTINIVPTLAGAQPDWVKIKDGPYVGGYVWRESTSPVADEAGADGVAE